MDSMNTNVPIPQTPAPLGKSRSFLSQYVIVLSILLIFGFGILGAYVLLKKNPLPNSTLQANDVNSPHCTNQEVYTDLTATLQLEGVQICYIEANAPSKDYVFPSDIVKHDTTRNLVSLSLNGYDLSAMQESLEVLQNLKVLKLTNAKLTMLPKGIDKLSNLETLDLSGNQFSEAIQTEIRQQLPDVKISF